MVGHEVVGTSYPDYLTSFYETGVRLTPDHDLVAVRRSAEGLVALLRNGYTGAHVEREVDQVVVEYGTEPNDEIYLELRDRSANRGESDLSAVATGVPQQLGPGGDGPLLFRVGDALAGRNIHAGMYDARRLALTI